MNTRVSPLTALVGRARRAAWTAGAAGLVLGLLAVSAAAMPSLKGHSTSAADSTGGLPRMSPLPRAPAVAPDLSRARKVKEVILIVRHRVFHDFAEQVVARLGESFPISDTEYSATVDQYVPDFAMDIKSGRVLSRTAETNNPAVRVVIKQKGVVQDTTWALLDVPPHFARKSMLAFQVMKINYTSGKPLMAKQASAPGGKGK